MSICILVANRYIFPFLTVLSFVVNLSLDAFYLLVDLCLIISVACLHPLVVSVPASVRLVYCISLLLVRIETILNICEVGGVQSIAVGFIGIKVFF